MYRALQERFWKKSKCLPKDSSETLLPLQPKSRLRSSSIPPGFRCSQNVMPILRLHGAVLQRRWVPVVEVRWALHSGFQSSMLGTARFDAPLRGLVLLSRLECLLNFYLSSLEWMLYWIWLTSVGEELASPFENPIFHRQVYKAALFFSVAIQRMEDY